MSTGTILWCIFVPPIAVWNRGCGTTLLVTILWCLGWLPGTIAAFIIASKPLPNSGQTINIYNPPQPPAQ